MINNQAWGENKRLGMQTKKKAKLDLNKMKEKNTLDLMSLHCHSVQQDTRSSPVLLWRRDKSSSLC